MGAESESLQTTCTCRQNRRDAVLAAECFDGGCGDRLVPTTLLGMVSGRHNHCHASSRRPSTSGRLRSRWDWLCNWGCAVAVLILIEGERGILRAAQYLMTNPWNERLSATYTPNIRRLQSRPLNPSGSSMVCSSPSNRTTFRMPSYTAVQWLQL